MSVEEAAIGIYRLASAQITDLIREITVERGLDPRDYALHSFGGSCGMLSADIVHQYATTRTLRADTDPEEINRIYEPMVAEAREQLKQEGFKDDEIRLEWAVDLHYARQVVHELTTTVRGATPMDQQALEQLLSDFEALYERKYGKGSAYREAGIEMKLFRLTARYLCGSARQTRARRHLQLRQAHPRKSPERPRGHSYPYHHHRVATGSESDDG
ncbi:hypothetical protein CJO09_15270 [Neopusillimonas maritima]|uniref:Uncharacterized protein n=1 Tax=Neopusillimonas maritima TaxID=2026239 RepID=A0ABX9MUA1_9BURK|nr:hypothetical protein CJO09_15270 [Neopusillimonas maritima]